MKTRPLVIPSVLMLFMLVQTVSGYGWVASPEEFEDMVDKRLFSPSH